MDKIKIVIPDNLSHDEELAAITKELGKKMLPANSRKQIGSGYLLNHLQTEIIIERQSIDKPIVTRECAVCQTIFELALGKKLYSNYGGRVKKLFYCSDKCRQFMIDVSGDGRVTLTRNKLKYFANFLTNEG